MFISKEATASGRARKVFRQLFVTPKETEQLSQELETAIRGFLVCRAHHQGSHASDGVQLTAVVDANMRVEENSQYLGQVKVVWTR